MEMEARIEMEGSPPTPLIITLTIPGVMAMGDTTIFTMGLSVAHAIIRPTMELRVITTRTAPGKTPTDGMDTIAGRQTIKNT